MEYRREIDGLRAVAVLPVILFHAGFKAFAGGFVGVDIFFVISGYLITTIILADMNKGKFSIVTFYERRARRILPAVFFVMFCSLPFAWFWLLPNHLEDFSQSLAAVSAFSSNILFWRESGYFGTEAELKPLLHTWSLAVEEQYYVFFPLFLMALWRLRKRWILGALIVIAIASLILAQWGAYHKPAATFFLLPTRGWELAIGAVIAFYFLYKKEQAQFIASHRAASEVFGSLGLILICYSIVAFDKFTPFPSIYALIPTIGTALIIVFATADTLVGRLLSTKLMVGIGLISYSAYLWHQPLFVFTRHRSLTEPSVAMLLFLSSLSIILAYFSWRFVEIPFRDKKAVNRKKLFSFAVAGSLFFATLGLAGDKANGFDKRTNSSGVELSNISKKVIVNNGLSKDCENEFTLSENCRTSEDPEILLWGDSYAMHLAQGVMSSNASAKIIQMTKSSCGPIFGVAPVTTKLGIKWADGCLEFNDKVHDWLKSNKTVKYAVLSSELGKYITESQLLIDGKLYDSSKELAAEHFIATLDELKNMGITPVVFSPVPQNGDNIGECLVRAEFFGGDLNSCSFSRDSVTANSNKIYNLLSNISDKYRVVFLDQGICVNGICRANFANTFIYRDDEHLTYNGSALLGQHMGFYNLIVGNK